MRIEGASHPVLGELERLQQENANLKKELNVLTEDFKLFGGHLKNCITVRSQYVHDCDCGFGGYEKEWDKE